MVISYEIGSDGGGWLIANLVPDGAGSYSWERCPPHRGCVPVASLDQGRTLEAGNAARGTVFVAIGVNAAGRASARSLSYRGPVVAVRAPQAKGELRVGALVEPVAGRWVGGWGNERDRLQLEACRSRSGGCVVLSDSVYENRLPGVGAIPPARDLGWFVRVVDQRIGQGEVFPRIRYASGHVPLIAPGPDAASTTVGPIAGAPVGQAATAAVARRTAPDGGSSAAAIRARRRTARAAAATEAVLVSVSCPAVSACTAVGDDGNYAGSSRQTLVEHWNGAGWTIQPSPNRAGASENELQSVSCSAVNWCVAVGSTETSVLAPGQLLAERWNGVRWSILRTPRPPAASGGFLASVSCVSTTSCAAVGAAQVGAGANVHFVTAAERWNGASWTIQRTPNREGANFNELQSVSCATANRCTAVGDVVGESVGEAALAERWNGTRWSIQPTPAAGAVSDLTGVSCPDSTACVAVGLGTGDAALTERWNGTSWSIEPAPHKPGGAVNAAPSAISCTTARACTGIGMLETNKGLEGALAERWNGARWTIQAVPQGIGGSNLQAVACPSDSLCIAVGAVGVGSGANPGNGPVPVPAALIESWNGTAWTIQQTPTVAG